MSVPDEWDAEAWLRQVAEEASGEWHEDPEWVRQERSDITAAMWPLQLEVLMREDDGDS